MRKISMLTGLMSSLLAAPAIAQDLEVVGRPHQGGIGFQPAATELAREAWESLTDDLANTLESANFISKRFPLLLHSSILRP